VLLASIIVQLAESTVYSLHWHPSNTRQNNYTVEPLNKGHFESRAFVLFLEVVLWWEVRANMQFIAPSSPNIPRYYVLKLRLLH